MAKPQFIIGVNTGLKKTLVRIALAVETLGENMTLITDRLDAALTAWQASENDEDLRNELNQQTIAALRATIADLEAQLAAGEAASQENIDALTRAADALEAATAANNPAPEEPPADEG